MTDAERDYREEYIRRRLAEAAVAHLEATVGEMSEQLRDRDDLIREVAEGMVCECDGSGLCWLCRARAEVGD